MTRRKRKHTLDNLYHKIYQSSEPKLYVDSSPNGVFYLLWSHFQLKKDINSQGYQLKCSRFLDDEENAFIKKMKNITRN